MLLLLPTLLLLVSLPALAALQRWRPAFKSYWFVAVGSALLAALVWLGLRFSLPHTAAFAGWRVGGAEFPLSLRLDGFSWPLAFTLAALLLARLLGSVRRASSVEWPAWLPSLSIAAVALPAVVAGDLLTAALALFVLDAFVLGLHGAVAPADERAAIVERFALNAGSVLLALLAWATPPSYADFGHVLLLLAAGLRLLPLGIPVATQQPVPAFATMLRLGPQAAALGLLLRVAPLSGLLLQLGLAALLLLAVWAGLRALKDTGSFAHLHQGLAALCLAAAAAGAPAAVLGFGFFLLFSETLVELAGRFMRARLPLAWLTALLLCGSPFTLLGGVSQQYAAAASPLVFAFLLPHALLLLSLLQRAGQPAVGPAPDEPWTLAVETGGAALGPFVFLLLGLLTETSGAPLWPGPVVLVLTAALWGARRSKRSPLPPHWRMPALRLPSGRRAVAALVSGLGSVLRLLSGMLEGEAGLLWAMLFIALLISIVAQSGLAG